MIYDQKIIAASPLENPRIQCLQFRLACVVGDSLLLLSCILNRMQGKLNESNIELAENIYNYSPPDYFYTYCQVTGLRGDEVIRQFKQDVVEFLELSERYFRQHTVYQNLLANAQQNRVLLTIDRCNDEDEMSPHLVLGYKAGY